MEGLMGLGVTELLLILVIVLVLFGASKLTKTMGDVGKGVRAFKEGLKEESSEPTKKD
jgi:sec-independent protein translocase protein TatA